MSELQTIRVGILGFGTVGQGTWKHLVENAQSLKKILGVEVIPTRASVRDLLKERKISIGADQLTEDSLSIVEDPEIDLICELIGGIEEAKNLTLRAFENGKSVVTANKALICEHGEELFSAAENAGVRYAFEASVAGGIPIIKVLRESLVANEFPLIYGILNGTSNYILTRMEKEGASFDEVLSDARDLGYVEADESLDLDGVDAAHKAVILSYLAHGMWINLEDITVEGIREISNADLLAARKLGCKIKLIGVIRRNFDNNHISVGVYPALVPIGEIIARTDGVYNGVSLTGTVVGTVVLTGRGAGQDPTAGSVVSDIVDVVKAMKGMTSQPKLLHVTPDECTAATAREVFGRFYLRLYVDDRPGQLAKIAECLSEHEVSLATVSQTPQGEDSSASIILTTHETNEHSIELAIKALKQLPGIKQSPVLFRMFDPNGFEKE
ncbi:MAG: homoserine dehydrogenase [Opitutae bacterium]|nr:homoserine dehydrogenase [Opitutae bacterium]